MVDPETGEPYTAHTVGKVQAVLVNYEKPIKGLKDGKLADLAPTMLEMLGIEQPKEMSGKSLIEK
jgi:2,3-bisphosphoglycerate-independent phosphoglycerate mutase